MELFEVKELLVTDPESGDEEVHLIPHGKHLVVQVGTSPQGSEFD